jgi:hypothetical protein
MIDEVYVAGIKALVDAIGIDRVGIGSDTNIHQSDDRLRLRCLHQPRSNCQLKDRASSKRRARFGILFARTGVSIAANSALVATVRIRAKFTGRMDRSD